MSVILVRFVYRFVNRWKCIRLKCIQSSQFLYGIGRHRWQIIPAKDKQPAGAKRLINRAKRVVDGVEFVQSTTIDAIEYDHVQRVGLEMVGNVLTRIDDMRCATIGCFIGTDFHCDEIAVSKYVGVVKRIPSATDEENSFVLGRSQQLRKDHLFQKFSVRTFFSNVDAEPDQVAMQADSKLLE